MNKVIRRALARAGALVLIAAAMSVAGSTPAHAAIRFGCAYPRVCFYKTVAAWNAQRPTAAYRDYGLQTLGPASTDAYMVYNSRNDDGALLHLSPPGGLACILPGQAVPWAFARAINIMDSPNC